MARFVEVNEPDDIWMIELSHDLYLLENICALQRGYKLATTPSWKTHISKNLVMLCSIEEIITHIHGLGSFLAEVGMEYVIALGSVVG